MRWEIEGGVHESSHFKSFFTISSHFFDLEHSTLLPSNKSSSALFLAVKAHSLGYYFSSTLHNSIHIPIVFVSLAYLLSFFHYPFTILFSHFVVTYNSHLQDSTEGNKMMKMKGNDLLTSLEDFCWCALEPDTNSNRMAPVDLQRGQQQEAAVSLGRSRTWMWETVNIK